MINLIIGRQGSGKTLFLVKMASMYAKEGKTIYSNVKLNVSFKPLDYNDIINYKLENAVILIDEIHVLLPARQSMKKTSIKIVDGFLSMVRKKGLIIYGTTQYERKVDIRFREEKDFLYICSKYAYIEESFREVSGFKHYNKDVPIMISCDVLEVFSGTWLKFGFSGNELYNLYDTTQIIEITGLDDA